MHAKARQEVSSRRRRKSIRQRQYDGPMRRRPAQGNRLREVRRDGRSPRPAWHRPPPGRPDRALNGDAAQRHRQGASRAGLRRRAKPSASRWKLAPTTLVADDFVAADQGRLARVRRRRRDGRSDGQGRWSWSCPRSPRADAESALRHRRSQSPRIFRTSCGNSRAVASSSATTAPAWCTSVIGRKSFTDEQIRDNLYALVDAVSPGQASWRQGRLLPYDDDHQYNGARHPAECVADNGECRGSRRRNCARRASAFDDNRTLAEDSRCGSPLNFRPRPLDRDRTRRPRLDLCALGHPAWGAFSLSVASCQLQNSVSSDNWQLATVGQTWGKGVKRMPTATEGSNDRGVDRQLCDARSSRS